MTTFFRNVTVGGGVAPVRAYIEELLPDVLEGRIEPGRVFDRTGHARRGARRLPRDERARGDQGHGRVLTPPDPQPTRVHWPAQTKPRTPHGSAPPRGVRVSVSLLIDQS